MDFTAIDVETANSNLVSICQIGVVRFRSGAVAKEWKSYVDPEDEFDFMNVEIHGIDESTVQGAPTFSEVFPTLDRLLSGEIVVSHTAFDRVAVTRALELNEIPLPDYVWLDSARVVRRTWKEFAWRGYGLSNVASNLGIEFGHHDALEDARAAGLIVVRAIQESGLSVTQWLDRVKKPIDPTTASRKYRKAIRKTGNPDGPLSGESVTFTGSLSVPRVEAAELAAQAGCDVNNSVTKATTLLVVGDQDLAKLKEQKRSSKQRKAEKLLREGQAIKVLMESDFWRLVKIDGDG